MHAWSVNDGDDDLNHLEEIPNQEKHEKSWCFFLDPIEQNKLKVYHSPPEVSG